MLSYRHAFHAGNHADVLKHIVLLQLCQHLARKETPFSFIDTHAGAGGYALDSAQAAQLAEYEHGIARVWERGDAPPAVADYLARVKAFNAGGKLRRYPGSPWLAAECLRANDRLHLCELHPVDARLLREAFKNAGRRITVSPGDGLAALKALLPPPSRRGVVFIDPAYENKSEYFQISEALAGALKRFATGVYAVWYPELAKIEARRFPERLKTLAGHWLHVTLSLKNATGQGFGMTGSGVFIINPPWTLRATLQESLPWLAETLGGKAARFAVEEKGVQEQ